MKVDAPPSVPIRLRAGDAMRGNRVLARQAVAAGRHGGTRHDRPRGESRAVDIVVDDRVHRVFVPALAPPRDPVGEQKRSRGEPAAA